MFHKYLLYNWVKKKFDGQQYSYLTFVELRLPGWNELRLHSQLLKVRAESWVLDCLMPNAFAFSIQTLPSVGITSRCSQNLFSEVKSNSYCSSIVHHSVWKSSYKLEGYINSKDKLSIKYVLDLTRHLIKNVHYICIISVWSKFEACTVLIEQVNKWS